MVAPVTGLAACLQEDVHVMLSHLFERFAKSSPVTVMVQALLEHALNPQFVDDLFQRHARRQKARTLLFSTLIDLMTLVVCRVRPSLHAAYQLRCEQVNVAVKCVYNKLNRVEPHVARQLARETSARLSAVTDKLGVKFPPVVKGYSTRILDGGHLAATERRLKELRKSRSAPLPGQVLCVLDGDRRTMVDVFPYEDAHAQERSFLIDVLDTQTPGELWIADRNFCTSLFLFQTAANGAYIIVRQHATNVRWTPEGKRRRVGSVDGGVVYEQAVKLWEDEEICLLARRVTVVLDKPTEDGDREIHLLTNLPKKVRACVVSSAYRQRWRVEGAFGELDAVLEAEIDTLAYPRAALLAFCLATIAYNLMRTMRAALASVHGVEKVEQEVSSYYLGAEIGATWRGMLVAIPDTDWQKKYSDLPPRKLALQLKQLARQVQLRQFKKHTRGPKKPVKLPPLDKRHPHVATARVLAEQK